MFPFLRAWSWFLSIKRFDSFPFYIQPGVKSVASFENTVLQFCDYLVDAHELERNKEDNKKSQYNRTEYVARNFHRY